MPRRPRIETTVVYAAGAVQGIVLVTFPAASGIFTDPQKYDLSNTQYGTLFLPQVAMAITASLLGAVLGRRFGTKRVLLAGLGLSLVSMSLVLVSQLVMTNTSAAYALLLVATACLGAGFGLAVPALNTLAAALRPEAVDSSVLVLNALLGLGTVLAPVFVAVFDGLGFWWGLPLLSLVLLAVLVAVSLPLPLRTGARAVERGTGSRGRTPSRLWVYLGFAVLYGFCETVNGNWSQTDMTKHLGATATQASLALTAFWAMVTVGRVLFALVERRLSSRTAYHVLPFVLVVAFAAITHLPEGNPALGILAFGLAGLGCSALLPLTIGFGQEELVALAATVTGGVIAAYQLGYGIAAFGVGPLLDHGVAISDVYAAAAVVALAMGAVSFVVARTERARAATSSRRGEV
jgi:MFS family permease